MVESLADANWDAHLRRPSDVPEATYPFADSRERSGEVDVYTVLLVGIDQSTRQCGCCIRALSCTDVSSDLSTS
jgi:hypothetical protein